MYDREGLYRAVLGLLAGSQCPGLVEVCRQLGVGRRSVERACNAHGKSFRRTRLEFRSRAALDALGHSGAKTIKQLAVDAGYTPSSFCLMVRQRSGMSPTRYRAARQSHAHNEQVTDRSGQ